MSTIVTAATLLATEGAKKLAGNMVSCLEKGLPRAYTDVTSKKKIDTEDAYEEYIKKVYETYSKSKTILYRNEEKELSSFFEPPFLRKEKTHFNKAPEAVIIPSENVEEIFKQGGHSKILITGIGGTGKTILLKHLCVNSIVAHFKIPVFISLRWFNDMDMQDKPLDKLIYERLEINGFQLPYKYFQYSLGGDNYVFLFDGYDEISEEKRRVITKKISDFTKHYSDNYFVMTSRPVDRVYGWDAYTIFELCPMAPNQVKRLILKLEFDAITKQKFVNELRTSLYDKYESLASIPLTLSVLFLTYVHNTTIPETLQEFYESAFNTLLYQHDTLKEGYERVLKSKIGHHKFREIFIQFCFITYFKDAYSFSEARLIEHISDAVRKANISVDVNAYKDDLVDVACMLIRDGREYIFLHRSFQEYFAACYVSSKIEEEQLEFCAAFLREHRLLKIQEFISMLKSIEPNRYEKVVLLPILEKIHKMYLKTDCDLIKTAALYYQIVKVRDPKAKYKYILVLAKQNSVEQSESITYGESIVLDYIFYNDIYDKSPYAAEMGHYMSENIKRISHVFKIDLDTNIYSIEVSRCRDKITCYLRALSSMKAYLDKYDELVSSNSQKLTFTEMIDKF